MISFHRGLVWALGVVGYLQTMDEMSGVTIDVLAFQGSREQGLQLRVSNAPLNERYSNTSYYVAEHRTSDDIVVYVGPPESNGGGMYREDDEDMDAMWANPICFPHGDIVGAANWIANDIKERLGRSPAMIIGRAYSGEETNEA